MIEYNHKTNLQKERINMKKNNRVLSVKISYIAISALTVMLGVFLIVCPDISLNIICRILGAAMTVCGAIKLAGYFSKDLYRLAFEHDLFFGTILCVVGIAALVRPTNIISSLHSAAGILILADGIYKAKTAFEAKRFGLSEWKLIAVFAVLTLAAGTLLLFRPFETAKTMAVIFGAAMIIDGILNLIVAVFAVKANTKQQYIDAEYYVKNSDDIT